MHVPMLITSTHKGISGSRYFHCVFPLARFQNKLEMSGKETVSLDPLVPLVPLVLCGGGLGAPK